MVPTQIVFLNQDRIVNILALCAYHLQHFIEINDNAGLILSNQEAKAAASSLQTHLRTYALLAQHFYDRRIMLYKIRPKSHYLWHTASELGLWKINVNLFHTFQEESFLGKLKCIAVRCHGKAFSQRVYQRYFLCLAIFMEDFRKMDLE